MFSSRQICFDKIYLTSYSIRAHKFSKGKHSKLKLLKTKTLSINHGVFVYTCI